MIIEQKEDDGDELGNKKSATTKGKKRSNET